MTPLFSQPSRPTIRVKVVEQGDRVERRWIRCEIGTHIRFNTQQLESYFFASWQPVVFDLMLLAAAVEYCDRRLRRPALGWSRQFQLRIPVHEPERWREPKTSAGLQEALNFLTGDAWAIEFTGRASAHPQVYQGSLSLPNKAEAVIPFSSGLDSRSVAGLVAKELGDGLVRIRLGNEKRDKLTTGSQQPFTAIPYKVRGIETRLSETSARSRGFKFAVISLAAAHLAGLSRVIVPESGQGALGPALVPVGHAYEDYRNHPLFTERVEAFAAALLGKSPRYEFPRLWHTKGQTLAAFIEAYPGDSVWKETWSCWQDSRQAFVAGKKRQCGICAACMLRRMSIHAAHVTEDPRRYVWERLDAKTFEEGAAADYPAHRINGSMAQYALAGTLHLEHLAQLAAPGSKRRPLERTARQIGRARGMAEAEAERLAQNMVAAHASEWSAFLGDLGAESFINRWAKPE